MSDPDRIDAANWRTSPFNRWAFHHVPEILATRTINAAADKTVPMPVAMEPLDDFHLQLPGGACLDLSAFLAATATDALVIVRDGHLVHESYFNGMTPESPHILMSGTKALVGLLAALLAGDGVLDLDAGVTRYLPEMAGSGYAGASVRDLLDMRTGVAPDEAWLRAYTRAVHRDIGNCQGGPGLHALLRSVPRRPRAHGGPFAYLSPNTDLAGWVMERITGQPLVELAGERLWRPMGAEHDALMMVDAEQAPWCAGGWCATARDFARVGCLLVNPEIAARVPGLSAALISDLHNGGDRSAWQEGQWGEAFAAVGRAMRYRAGWYSVHDAPAYLFAMGVHGQNLFVDRHSGIVVAKFSSQHEPVDRQAMGLTHLGWRELARVLRAAC